MRRGTRVPRITHGRPTGRRLLARLSRVSEPTRFQVLGEPWDDAIGEDRRHGQHADCPVSRLPLSAIEVRVEVFVGEGGGGDGDALHRAEGAGEHERKLTA